MLKIFSFLLVLVAVLIAAERKVLNAVETSHREPKQRNRVANAHRAINYNRFDSTFIAPVQRGAVIMLVKRWKAHRGRKCNFNSSMDMLEQNFRPHNPYPIILMETQPWKHDDMAAIRRRWKTLDFQFLNVEDTFNKAPAKLVPFEDAKAPLSKIHYKRMCHFFFCGFVEVPHLRQFRYLLRLDDDSCILDRLNYDIFEEMAARGAYYGFRDQFHDPPHVTKGMLDFARNYSQHHQLLWSNERLHNASFARGANEFLLSFSTNFEVIDTVRYRQRDIMGFVDAVVDSNMIFHRRWGDAPLRHMVARMFWTDAEIVHFCDFDYQHSQWGLDQMCPFRAGDNPVYHSGGKLMGTS